MWKKIFAALLCIALMISGTVLAVGESDSLEERIEELEKRVAELEKIIAAIEAGETLQPPEDEIRSMKIGETVRMGENLQVQVDSFYFADQFSYYTSAYGRSRSIKAADGYDILCLLVNFENEGLNDISVNNLLDVKAIWNGGDKDAYDQFYCEISDDYFYSGVYTVGGKTSITGALLFAIPEEDVQSNGSLKIHFNYGDDPYSCVLREDASLRVPTTDDTVTF